MNIVIYLIYVCIFAMNLNYLSGLDQSSYVNVWHIILKCSNRNNLFNYTLDLPWYFCVYEAMLIKESVLRLEIFQILSASQAKKHAQKKTPGQH